jgi:uncharacterized protein (DUF2126 family)/transglutaminase-like putative cysteine protease
VPIHVALNHRTSYRYDRLVGLSPQIVRLRPAPHCRTPIISYSLRVTPATHFVNWQQDPQSNYLARLTFPERVREFALEVDLVAEMAVYNPFDFFLEPHAERIPFAYEPWQLQELQPYLRTEPLTPRFGAYLREIPLGPARTIDALVAINQRLQHDITYVIRMEPGIQPPERTLDLARGSCRDSAWLLVQLLRHRGLAARFVSGYLVQLRPDVKPLDGPAGPGSDFTDLHAWCEVYLPGAGWIGLDPTSGLLAGEGHIPLSCTPEPAAAAPVTGAVDECEVEFHHAMRVTRIYESPRVTKPYTDAQWGAIVALGDRVDADLTQHDVRLTMGGEPTFVAVDDPDGAEWNIDALGPTKRLRAGELLERLRARYAPRGFVHVGQGKWYPGEQLPRWSFACYWRRDGEPTWTETRLIADEREPVGHTAPDAERFVRHLATRLGVSDEYVQPGFEDVWYYLWRERRLPVNVDPFESRLDDELERARLRRVFSQKLDTVVGYALPLDWLGARATRWRSGPWFMRDGRMYLIPGDSPMGYRLPLDALPWSAAGDRPTFEPPDPFATRAPLPSHAVLSPAPRTQPSSSAAAPATAQVPLRPNVSSPLPVGPNFSSAARGQSARGQVRTAVCTEARDGVLYLFMPPIDTLDAYLELVAAIEATAADLDMPVLLEGYRPPSDPRLAEVLVTPDPGVIEVNVPPASTWTELVDQTTSLYEDAHRSRLTSEKFMLDGRHTGTGGGNHFVLGGATAEDSPLLRRPDLLRSLLAYWHNHPSLSYLFSGLFMGPTSQAPRLDEARQDSVYELDIAFAKVPTSGAEAPPWLVDRLFRHLLVDVTGNTHRAEFCIDKLYSPDTAQGRRGLLELRAFEMPPHARMSVAQQLLLRALVARFWQAPYTARLTRWGTELHDRFMLPYFVELDFDDVLHEMRESGYAFDAAWFAPHFEFRFPLAGQTAMRGVQLTLRQALEPWHVLGEEGVIGGTVRYVDSSVERLQVLMAGLTPERYLVACNGRALPLQPTGRNGEYVAGVRFKAWQPPSGLHPTIPVHAPLTFDIVDTWSERSLGGCQYHVMHPGGRNYDRFPVNSYEAESRRLARFFAMGHTPGRQVVAPPARTREFPYTLDLRT